MRNVPVRQTLTCVRKDNIEIDRWSKLCGLLRPLNLRTSISFLPFARRRAMSVALYQATEYCCHLVIPAFSLSRFQYEEDVKKNPLNYDAWFDYVRLEESNGDKEKVRDVYERAIANIPPAEEKRYWQRYIYLW
jgi:hypothetical protein